MNLGLTIFYFLKSFFLYSFMIFILEAVATTKIIGGGGGGRKNPPKPDNVKILCKTIVWSFNRFNMHKIIYTRSWNGFIGEMGKLFTIF